jgi:hypothetical protein
LHALPQLVDAVQANCHIADARHAREMTMCNYLLGMRELYRWEHEIPLARPLPPQLLGDWLSAREALWEGLEADDFRPVPVDGRNYDPFDIAAINDALAPHGLVYGGGYGRFGTAHFFLGELLHSEKRHGLTVLVSGCEHARDMLASPAALRNGAIFLRQDALRRWLWEKIEIWGVRKADGALKAALDCHGFAGDAGAALERMAAQVGESLILHEVGEGMAEPLLGPAWREMLASFSGRRAEILARAVRDNLADCLSTLPALIGRKAECCLHFHFANFEGMRKALFPALAQAYLDWRTSGSMQRLQETADAGRAHWTATALRLLEIQRGDPAGAERIMEEWAENPGELALGAIDNREGV